MLVLDRDNPSRDTRGADMLSQHADPQLRPQRDGSFSKGQLWRFLWDIRLEPPWRREAEIDTAYYDNDQISSTVLERMRDLGMAPIVVNRIAAMIDSVAGFEVLTRSDLQVIPETEESYHVAMGLNMKFKEAQRLTRMNYWIGQQFKEAVKIGISWIEVTRNPDPFGYPYQILPVPWREIYPDYRARQPNYEDARYIVRRKHFDVDELIQHFPQHRDAIVTARSTNAGDGFLSEQEALSFQDDAAQRLAMSADQEYRFTLEQDEWRQRHRDRVALYEILYCVPRKAEVLRLRDGRVVELDYNDPMHLAALQQNMAVYGQGMTREWRQAWYVGPHRLGDEPLETNRPHYIPMVCYRKDNDGQPYGLTRRMRSVQEALNARLTRLLYDTASRKYLVDDDAVDDHETTAEEINKVNSYIVMRGDRRGDGVVQMPTTDQSTVTLQLLQLHDRQFYDVTGLHPEFMGTATSPNQSGIAIESLIEQTTKVLGIPVDNYRNAKTMAGEIMFHYMVADEGLLDNVEVETDARLDGQRQKIVLNARRADGERDNDILLARTKVALGETPTSVTYQQQKFQSLVEVVKSMPDEMQAVMMDLVVRAAALPDSEELMERIRSITGFGPEPKDPQKREAMRQQMEQQQQMEQKLAELQMALQEAEAVAKQADALQKRTQAEYNRARAEKTAGADTELTDAKTLTELATAETIPDEQDRKERETEAKAVEAAARLRKEATADEKPDTPKKKS